MEEYSNIKINTFETRFHDYSKLERINSISKNEIESDDLDLDSKFNEAMRISFYGRKKAAQELIESQRHTHTKKEITEILLEETSMNNSIDSSDNHRIPNIASTICIKPKMEGFPETSGFLKKKSPVIFKRWVTKFCSLKDFKLIYYNNLESEHPKGVIDFIFTEYFYSEEYNDDQTIKEFRLYSKEFDKTFRFRPAGSISNILIWCQGIKYFISKSNEARRPKKILKFYKFWKTEIIPYSRFLKEGDTLDIILFRGKTIGAKVQHAFTRSQYDHVAILVRFDNGKLALFEATGKEGVGICLWDQFVSYKWFLLYEKIVIRKLNYFRTNSMLKEIDTFMKSTIGKRFKISINKLFRKKEQKGKETTFFCSELAAETFKRIGLLPKEKVSSQYWPGFA